MNQTLGERAENICARTSEEIIKELEDVGHLDFDGGEGPDRMTVKLIISLKMFTAIWECDNLHEQENKGNENVIQCLNETILAGTKRIQQLGQENKTTLSDASGESEELRGLREWTVEWLERRFLSGSMLQSDKYAICDAHNIALARALERDSQQDKPQTLGLPDASSDHVKAVLQKALSRVDGILQTCPQRTPCPCEHGLTELQTWMKLLLSIQANEVR